MSTPPSGSPSAGQDHAVWPVISRYQADHLDAIELPIGGVGTGTIGLGGRGDLRAWQILNRPGKGFQPSVCLAAVWAKAPQAEPVTRLAEGPLPRSAYDGPFGSPAPNQGLPRFRDCSFEAAYPFGRVRLADSDVPITVDIEAVNPFVPTDLEASSWPVAVLRYHLTNPGDRDIDAAICLAIQNFIGADGVANDTGANRNTLRTAPSSSATATAPSSSAAAPSPGSPMTGLTMTAPDLPTGHEAGGEFTLAVLGEGATTRTSWLDIGWGDALLDFWEDFAADGRLTAAEPHTPATPADPDTRPVASLARRVHIPAGQTRTITFLLAWSFPNRRAWDRPAVQEIGSEEYLRDIVGNHYALVHPDSWQTCLDMAPQLPDLIARTAQFVRTFATTSVPDPIREAALDNLSTLRSQTLFRTADGRFFGWEGCGEHTGSCHGTCSHVWNYEFATAYLFPQISRSMRETQFALATDDAGLMSFRVGLPLDRAQDYGLAAADGQLGALVHLYADWRLTGDDELLAALWPHAKRALEFCWLPAGWDADRDGVIEGVQHNTMDVEYYGPNPQMGAWYVAALTACAQMARACGEHDFAAECQRLAKSGAQYLDAALFNGEYYEHEIRPLAPGQPILTGIRHPSMGAADAEHPDWQLGAGCLVDQLVGQYAAHLAGLGDLLDADHVAATMTSIMRYNFRPTMHGHMNHMRGFALGDESALLMASYPRGRRPKRPFPYFNEVMTGFEYTAATSMIFAGQRDAAVRVISAIRDRFDGAKRNPFDEPECGSHYARAMASYSALVAWTGFDYDGRSGVISFGIAPGQSTFWAAAGAWGEFSHRDGGFRLAVLGGALAVREICVTAGGPGTEPVRYRVADACSAADGDRGLGEIGAGQTVDSADCNRI